MSEHTGVFVWVDRRIMAFDAAEYELGEYGDLSIYDSARLVASFARGSWQGVWLGFAIVEDNLSPTRITVDFSQSAVRIPEHEEGVVFSDE
jgi:hypothetical protein